MTTGEGGSGAIAEELHIPLRVTRTGDSRWKAGCSCGSWGPLVSRSSEARAALAEAHGSREPASGCALCGREVPELGEVAARYPWQRYQAERGPTGRWEYVCRSVTACRQGRLGDEHQILAGEWWMPLDARGHGITASLDDDVVDVEYDLERAIAMYLLAQGASPRTWDSITSSSGDQRALAARAVALSALGATASSWRNYAILSARKSGVTWAHLAALLSTSAEDLRADLEEWYQEMDWPWDSRSVPPEIVEALRVDPRT